MRHEHQIHERAPALPRLPLDHRNNDPKCDHPTSPPPRRMSCYLANVFSATLTDRCGPESRFWDRRDAGL